MLISTYCLGCSMQRSTRAEMHCGCWRITSIPRKIACPSSSSLPGNALKMAISVTTVNPPGFFYILSRQARECHSCVITLFYGVARLQERRLSAADQELFDQCPHPGTRVDISTRPGHVECGRRKASIILDQVIRGKFPRGPARVARGHVVQECIH